jgi:hypothetical protein
MKRFTCAAKSGGARVSGGRKPGAPLALLLTLEELGRLEQHVRAEHVGARELERVAERVVHVALRRKGHDAVDLRGGGRRAAGEAQRAPA